MAGKARKTEPTYSEETVSGKDKGDINKEAKAETDPSSGVKENSSDRNLSLDALILDVGKVKTGLGKLKSEMAEFKVKTIEVLAIFVALFTFVSVDIQIFKSEISTLSAGGFTLIMFAALMFFTIALACSLDNSKIKDWRILLVSILFILIGVSGVVLIGLDYSGVEKTLKEKFYTKEQLYTKEEINTFINASSTNELDSLKKCIVNFGFTYKCFNQ